MKTAPTNQWSCSQNEEYWDNDFFPSKEEAIEAGKEWYLGESFEVGQMYIEDCYLDYSSDLVKLYNLSEYNLDIMSTNFMYDRYSQHFSTNEVYDTLSRQFIPAIKDRMEVECIEDISNGKTIYRSKIIIGTKNT